MSNDDGEVLEFKDRVYDVSKERCSDGVNISIYIVLYISTMTNFDKKINRYNYRFIGF